MTRTTAARRRSMRRCGGLVLWLGCALGQGAWTFCFGYSWVPEKRGGMEALIRKVTNVRKSYCRANDGKASPWKHAQSTGVSKSDAAKEWRQRKGQNAKFSCLVLPRPAPACHGRGHGRACGRLVRLLLLLLLWQRPPWPAPSWLPSLPGWPLGRSPP